MGYDEEINALRERIDEIDGRLTALFEQRMDAVKEVAVLKSGYGKPVHDATREDAVVERAASRIKNKEYGEDVKSFYRSLIDISKAKERRDMAPGPLPSVNAENERVGHLGIQGSFSHTAAMQAYSGSKLVSYDTFEAIFEGLEHGEIDLAMLPAENTETGSITAVVDLLARYGFFIVAEKLLKVSQSLLGVKGAAMQDIKILYSHPEPFAQCSSFLAAHPGIEARPSLSTAQAAKYAADAGDKAVGCIASSEAAGIYGLEVLKENIQNSDSNCTRFVVVARKPVSGSECDKTSIVFMVEHRPGSLCEILKVFNDGGVNILKLESRPIKGRPFEYMFHLDFEGSLDEPSIAATIGTVKQKAADYIFLGCYKREAGL
jgi:chorismate mutase/prephenate dehydratase